MFARFLEVIVEVVVVVITLTLVVKWIKSEKNRQNFVFTC